MEWLQLSVTTTTECSDLVSFILIELGSEGVSIKDSSDIEYLMKNENSWDYVDESLMIKDKVVLVNGFLPLDFDMKKFYAEIELLAQNSEVPTGSLEVMTSTIASEDWENVWKKYYLPIKIRNVVIVPQWINVNEDENTKVLIDPGMAFGTGNHETTNMCIKLAQDFDLEGKSVADVGCGSGILGITALKLGANVCHFIDIDEQAIKATNHNCKLNNVLYRAKIKNGNLLECVNDKMDIVIANITADILIKLKGELSKILKPNGKIIISGIIHSKAEQVLNEYLTSYKLLKIERSGEWQAMSFENKI